MSLFRDHIWTAAVAALSIPGAYVDGALELDALDPDVRAAITAVAVDGILPCGLPVRVRSGAAVTVGPAVLAGKA